MVRYGAPHVRVDLFIHFFVLTLLMALVEYLGYEGCEYDGERVLTFPKNGAVDSPRLWDNVCSNTDVDSEPGPTFDETPERDGHPDDTLERYVPVHTLTRGEVCLHLLVPPFVCLCPLCVMLYTTFYSSSSSSVGCTRLMIHIHLGNPGMYPTCPLTTVTMEEGGTVVHRLYPIFHHFFCSYSTPPPPFTSHTSSLVLGDPRKVRFRYPARPDALVFRNFNLRVESGSTVALVSVG